jgi:3-hydroxyisobutyrate dehydrogenase-like beta-hydroxyacid dehydrogenase
MDTQFSPQSAKTIGIIHPGQMGATIMVGLKESITEDGPYRLIWASEGRSTTTQETADKFGMVDVSTVSAVIEEADVVFCILRGGSMMEYAQMAVDAGFKGIWVDANGLWGAESETELADIFADSGIDYVEAGLYGWPWPGKEGYTDEHTMYLSGDKAQDIADLFVNRYWAIEIHDTSAKEVKRLRNEQEVDIGAQ